MVQYDLAALYRKRGREAEARAAFELVTKMPRIHPTDAALQDEAAAILEELES